MDYEGLLYMCRALDTVEHAHGVRPRPLSSYQNRRVEPTQVCFTVPGPPVGKNRRHHRTKRLTDEAREYLARIKNIGFAAAKLAGWRCVSEPRSLEIEVVTFNTKHDSDAALPLVRDGLEGALYDNDRAIKRNITDVSTDEHGPRVEVTVRRLRPDSI